MWSYAPAVRAKGRASGVREHGWAERLSVCYLDFLRNENCIFSAIAKR